MPAAPDALRDAIDRNRAALRAHPAPQRFAAHATLREGTEVGVRLGARTLTVDEPADAGGTDRGPNPIELALGALGSCQLITFRMHASRLGVRLDALDVQVRADLDLRPVFGLDEPDPPGTGPTPAAGDTIRLRVELTGPEPEDRYRELHRLVERSCPVLAMTRGAVDVRSDLVVRR